jgi:hypothetical protein
MLRERLHEQQIEGRALHPVDLFGVPAHDTRAGSSAELF